MNLSVRVLTLDEYGGSCELTPEENQKAISLSFSLATSRLHYGRLIYRGVSKTYLSNRLLKESEKKDDYEIIRRIFYFGEKAKHFRNEMRMRNLSKWLNDIEDVSKSTCNKIFDRINGLRKSNNPSVNKFTDENSHFFDFFFDKRNKQTFYRMIKDIGPKARDYYLGFLHTVGSFGVGEKSISTSTTSSIYQAHRFAGKPKQERFIIISVDRSRRCEYLRPLTEKIKSHGVPVLDKGQSIFPRQKELTLRAGIFPHNIIGIICVHNKELIINPHIFSEENRNSNILMRPLFIDQTNFSRELAEKTNYSSWFYTFDHDELCEDVASSLAKKSVRE